MVQKTLDYRDILESFVGAKIKFCVIGGFAAVAHGVVRVTMDLDLAISMTRRDLEKSWDVLSKLGFLPRQPLTREIFADPDRLKLATEAKGAKAISFFHERQPYLIVDMLFSEEFQIPDSERVSLELFGVSCSVASVDKLIALKTLAGRAKDQEDIRELRKLHKK